MRVNFFSQSGNQNAGSSQGLSATMTGPLLLVGNPTGPLEATPKQYVDNVVNSLNAANIKTGTISAARLPAFTGDVSSATGSGIFLLANTGVVAGTYTKVTVDSKGRVLTGSNISIDDIPPFSWGKVTTGKPSTIAGYGITDALAKTDTTVTGTLSLNVDPTSALHAANKQYVDLLGGGGALLNTGIIVRRPTATTPAGFLRCNGGNIDKVTYAALYAVMGDINNIVQPGSGQPWRQQYQINTDGTLGAWTTGTSLPTTIYRSQVIVTKNRVYLLGGKDSSGNLSSTVYTAPINTDGTLGAWTTGTSLPSALSDSQAVVTKNRVYLLGGDPSTVYTAPINTDGTLGAWTTGTSLPTNIYQSQAIVTKNRVYLLGGLGGGASTVYTAPINTDGTLGAWATDTSLPTTIYDSQAIVTKNRVYLLGGIVGGGASSTVYTAPINTDGTLGAWTTDTSLPTTIYRSQAVVTKNRVYLLGGTTTGYVSIATVYTAPINTDGTLGTWTTSTSLPTAIQSSHVAVVNNNLYLLGGYDKGTFSLGVYVASFPGGLNDYSPYYDGSIITNTTVFALPDFTSQENSSEFYFIKT